VGKNSKVRGGKTSSGKAAQRQKTAAHVNPSRRENSVRRKALFCGTVEKAHPGGELGKAKKKKRSNQTPRKKVGGTSVGEG